MFRLYEAFRADLFTTNKIAIVAMIYAAFALTCVYYLKDVKTVSDILSNTRFAAFGQLIYAGDGRSNLPSLAYWVGLITIFYFVIPSLIIKLFWRQNIADYGLNPKIDTDFVSILLVCLLIMIPLVYLASLTSGFTEKYPFLKIYGDESYLGWTFLIWTLIYFFQFFCLEFFFRGFLVQSLKPTVGIYAIFVMTIPYCMIHFGKPPLEAFAAIIAGIFLGWLSYTNNNIWLGFFLHCSVALLMDIFALYQKKQLF